MTMRVVFEAATIFLRVVSVSIFAYGILIFLRFNNRLVQLLAKFIYPFVAPFRRPAIWVMRRTGLPFDLTLWFAIIGISIATQLLWNIYGWVFLPLGIR